MLNKVKSAFGGKNQNLLIVIVALIVFAGVSFFAGTKYQQSKTPTFGNFNRGGAQQAGAGNRQAGMRGGQILGDIISADANSVTVKLADGSSKIIFVSGTTNINQATTASLADLKVGTKVAAFGQTNTDGSVSAQNIQINPVSRAPEVKPTL
jgi:hypothetical protein